MIIPPEHEAKSSAVSAHSHTASEQESSFAKPVVQVQSQSPEHHSVLPLPSSSRAFGLGWGGTLGGQTEW